MIFDFQNTFTDWKRTMLSFLSGARQRVGFERQGYQGFLNTKEISAPQRKHEIEHYLGLVSELSFLQKDKETQEKKRASSFQTYFLMKKKGNE